MTDTQKLQELDERLKKIEAVLFPKKEEDEDERFINAVASGDLRLARRIRKRMSNK